MKKTTKIIIGSLAVILIIASTLLVNYLVSVNRYKEGVSQIIFNHSDASGIPDGKYIGEHDVDFIYARVEVTVENEEITYIELLEHRHDRGHDAEGIENEIIRQQKIDVDTVTNATNSSQVIKKAVDNALSSALS